MSDPKLIEHMGKQIDELKKENEQLREKNKVLKRINDKLHENVERFVTRKTINDYPIEDSIRQSFKIPGGEKGFDFRFSKKKPLTTNN